ncbi:MAG: hypothetical protein OES24_08360 [Acidimicrobiia bacterium]|nr:hypothetical protein [Acidimicrobiia bacterium]
MSEPDPVRLGRELAARHGSNAAEVDETRTLLQAAESPRVDDWTLRSALVRFAQPQPDLASAILESVRRTQAVLDPMARELMRHGVVTDRGLAVSADGGLMPMADPLPDVRVADLARLFREHPGGDDAPAELIDGYATATESVGSEPLAPAERMAVPLLAVLLVLDELADVLAHWASTVAPADPPVAEATRLGRLAFDRLGALGVAREPRERPPGRRPPARNRG